MNTVRLARFLSMRLPLLVVLAVGLTSGVAWGQMTVPTAAPSTSLFLVSSACYKVAILTLEWAVRRGREPTS
jgi:hypothetical protein